MCHMALGVLCLRAQNYNSVFEQADKMQQEAKISSFCWVSCFQLYYPHCCLLIVTTGDGLHLNLVPMEMCLV